MMGTGEVSGRKFLRLGGLERPRSGVSDLGGGLIMARGKVWFITKVRAVGSTFIIKAGGVVVLRSSVTLLRAVRGGDVEEDVAESPFPNRRGGAGLLWASQGSTIIVSRSQIFSRRGERNTFDFTGYFSDSSCGGIEDTRGGDT